MNNKQTSCPNTNGKNTNKTDDKPFKILIINVEDNRNTQEEIKKYKIDKNNIHIKFTANNNLMMYLKNIEDLDKISENNNIFKENKKINLEAETNNQVDIVIKNLSTVKANEYEETLRINGISKIIDFKSTRIVGAKCIDQNIKQTLINNGIKLGYSFHRVEQYAKPVHVLQCMNCFEFDHKASDCTNDIRCKNCGENHHLENCISNISKCCNCEEQHKATYKQCKLYISRALEKVNKIKEKRNDGKSVIRIHSEAKNKKPETDNISENLILKAINELKQSNANYEKHIDKKFEELLNKEKSNEDKINELSKEINDKVNDMEKVMDAKHIKTSKDIENICKKIAHIDDSIAGIQKDMINVFVDCHNSVNQKNQITVDHITKLFINKNKRDSNTKLKSTYNNNDSQQ